MTRGFMLFLLISIFTLGDLFFSYIGLKHGYITEANPILNYFISKASLNVTMISLLVIITGLLYFIYKASIKFRWVIYAMIGLFAVKTIIIFMHFNWIYQVVNRSI